MVVGTVLLSERISSLPGLTEFCYLLVRGGAAQKIRKAPRGFVD